MILGKTLCGSFSRIWNSLPLTEPSKTGVFSGMKRRGCVMGSAVNSRHCGQAGVPGVSPSFAFSVVFDQNPTAQTASALPQELESFFVST